VGRVAAISVPLDSTEKLVTIIELKKRGDSDEEAMHWLSGVKSDRHLRDIQCARRECWRPRSGTAPGRFPPRRAARSGAPPCVEQYRQDQFARLDRLSRPLGAHPELPMLVTVLVMAVAVSVEPFRIGMTVLMLNRPRPALQLLAFLSGGFGMGTTVGLVVLFVFRRRFAGVYLLHFAQGSDSDRGSWRYWSLLSWPWTSPGGWAGARQDWRRRPNDC